MTTNAERLHDLIQEALYSRNYATVATLAGVAQDMTELSHRAANVVPVPMWRKRPTIMGAPGEETALIMTHPTCVAHGEPDCAQCAITPGSEFTITE